MGLQREEESSSLVRNFHETQWLVPKYSLKNAFRTIVNISSTRNEGRTEVDDTAFEHTRDIHQIVPKRTAVVAETSTSYTTNQWPPKSGRK